jgi:predicted nucleotidyltransferase
MDKNVTREQQHIAQSLIEYLEEQRWVNSCTLHGSLAGERGDEYSDIDLQVDVSGHDNGKMVLMLPYMLQQRFSLAYIAFAPKFAPNLYVVSFALSHTSIFHVIDVECLATPHVASVQKDDIRQITHTTSLYAKLLIGCLKTYLRQQDCTTELQFLARQLHVETSTNTRIVLADCFAALHAVASGEVKHILQQGLTMVSA